MLKDLKQTPAGTLNIDWEAVEVQLGFQLHDNIKNYFSRVTGTYCKRGYIKFEPTEFSKKCMNRDRWLEDDGCAGGFVDYTLCLLNDINTESVCKRFKELFDGDWTGGNEFGHRAYIGEIIINIGQISIIFNNDTGQYEWVDFGWGYMDVYEENPYGIIADSTEEFLDKFYDEDEV